MVGRDSDLDQAVQSVALPDLDFLEADLGDRVQQKTLGSGVGGYTEPSKSVSWMGLAYSSGMKIRK